MLAPARRLPWLRESRADWPGSKMQPWNGFGTTTSSTTTAATRTETEPRSRNARLITRSTLYQWLIIRIKAWDIAKLKDVHALSVGRSECSSAGQNVHSREVNPTFMWGEEGERRKGLLVNKACLVWCLIFVCPQPVIRDRGGQRCYLHLTIKRNH